MAGTFEVFLFGDETGDFREPLQKLCERQTGVAFTNFIENLNKVLREEVRRQPRHVKQQIPPFLDVLDLVKHYRDSSSRNQILETTLACVCQLASVISYFDNHPSKYIAPSESALVGLCSGLLAATAVSASRSLLDLIANALHIVRVAFRLGVKVNSTSQRLSTTHDAKTSPSWSRLVLGIQKEVAISEVSQFNQTKSLPKANQAYISSNSKDVVTVSGPPATLKALFAESEIFRKRKTIPLDIFGPFHASHLYSDADVDEIVQPVVDAESTLAPPSIRVISGVTDSSLADAGMEDFLRGTVRNILIRPLFFDRLLSEVVSEASKSGKKICKISSVGPSNASSSLVSALRTGSTVEPSVGEQLGLTKPPKEPTGPSTKIAVVGMSARLPSADNLEGLWSLLEQGLDVHRRIPPDRFDVDAHYDPTGKKKNTSHTPYGCFIEEPGMFDPKFFNMSPREAYQTDPMGRLALVTAYEALEMSGFVPNRTPSSMLDRIGTFYGQTSDDWRQVNAAQTIDTYYIPGTIRAFATGRINYFFKFRGPSYNVDTACSSSFSAIQLACTALQAKECDTALAGGLNVMTTPDLFAGLSRAQFLSKTGSCKTFDNSADGFCRGDGVATVVLKRLEDAEADSDPILGVILGTATNHSSEAISITQPHGPAQEFLYRKILRNTGVEALDVSYVEMHGTGTQAGDGTEMKSITNVFAPRGQVRGPDETLHLGAIKANIGHGEASAGVASLVKVLVMLQKSAIPPHVGVKGTINKTFPTDLEERGVRIAFKQTPWSRPIDGKRRAYLNNFGASGGNTGLLLEDGPISQMDDNDPRTHFVVSVTAKSAFSLGKNVHNLISYLDSNPSVSISKLSYTTTARRMHQPYRISFAASSISDAKRALLAAQGVPVKAVSPKPPKVSFVFTGQGAHYPAVGKQLFEDSEQFRSDIIEFDRIGRNQGFPSFLSLIDGSVMDVDSLSPVILQLGQTCIQMALANLWMSWGILPTAVLGHSLGEYAALNVAGVLSVSDTIYLVGRRAELLQKSCTAGTHAMLAVAASLDSTKKLLFGEKLEVACINGPRETVISGSTEQMISFSKTLKASNFKCVLLPTAYAFHSAQVDAILDRFDELCSSVTFGNPTVPVISPLFGEVLRGRDAFCPEYLTRHARETVDFQGALGAATNDGLIDQNTVWIEIGPASICSSLLKSTLGSETVAIPSLRKKEDAWKTMTNGLSALHLKGLQIDWHEVHREYDSSHTVLTLPTYTFENKNYWLEYTNNWCLTKGEALEAPVKRIKDGRLSTSSVQKVIKEDLGKKITLIAESDLSNPDLNAAITGHLVNGSALVPSATYAEMALTIASYIQRKVNSKAENVGMDVRHLEIVKPLIRDPKKQQAIRMTATADQPLKSVKISWNSVLPDGKAGELHATTTVDYGDTKAWAANWSKTDYLFRSRIDVLLEGAKTGKYTKVNREKTYEGFAALVTYDKKYHGMKEVVLDNRNLEATSLVEFTAKENDGDFDYNPFWIDNIIHVSGYILNGSGAVDSTKQVYISHGWESLQVTRTLSATKKYHNYVKMIAGPRQTMAGDVYVFDGEEMIAFAGGVKFQAIPRAVLNRLLPPINGASAYPTQAPSSTKAPAKSRKAPSQPSANNISIPLITKTAPPPSPPVSGPQHSTSSTIKEFLSIVSEELGVEPSELPDSAEFADVGLDSLMALTITGRMREELDLDVPTSMFTDNATVGEAKKVILALGGGSPHAVDDESPPTEPTPKVPKFRTPKSQAPKPQSINSSMIKGFLNIISEELGVEPSELTKEAEFADVGLDSLMALTITGRIREDLDLEVPTSLFTDNATIGAAKAAILTIAGESSNRADQDEGVDDASAADDSNEVDAATDSTATTDVTSSSEMAGRPSTGMTTPEPSTGKATEKLLDIISEELGVDEAELIEMNEFAEMGLDSLMSLTITGRFREELDIDIPTSFFTDYPTITEARTAMSALLGGPSPGGITPYTYTENTTPAPASETSLSTPDEDTQSMSSFEETETKESLRPATSILLQGNPKTATKSLFLFPDGSGSATSYGKFAPISSEICVYGLNCPYMKTPSEYANGIEGVSQQYLAEIKRRQPKGPYYLGGWSAGGVLAYSVAYQMIETGEDVERLVLIDSPCPINLEPLPSPLLHYIDSLGLLGSNKGQPPAWLIPHFEASIRNLADFIPYPMDPDEAPKTLMIWAEDGLDKDTNGKGFGRSSSEPKSVKFLLDNREKIGFNGWDKLLGQENIKTAFVEGNHFTMIRDPKVKQLADLLKRGLGA